MEMEGEGEKESKGEEAVIGKNGSAIPGFYLGERRRPYKLH